MSAMPTVPIRRLNVTRLAGMWLAVLFVASALGARSDRPNIIFVLIDDLGWADFSCFGNAELATPHIDRLAREGVRFSQFYVAAPICSPSRAAFVTGQHPQRWRITSFLNNRADNELRGMAQWLDPDAPSVARLLREAGYATGHFGKWHLGGQRDVDDAPPISAYGFEASLTNFEGMGPKLLPLTLRPGDTAPGRIWQDAERLGGPFTWRLRSEITAGFVDAAIAFMDEAAGRDRPFYVNLWPDDVHSPFWPSMEHWAETKRGRYLAVLAELDRQIGRLADHVRASPALRDNTIVLICSDNGHEPGAGQAGAWRGAKGTLYEGGVRSPLIVWAPGRIDAARAGTRNDTAVFSAFEFAPTLLQLAGVAVPAGVTFDGEALPGTLLGRSDASRAAPLFWRRPPDRKHSPFGLPPQPDLAMRSGRWKLLCDYDGTRPELYDLERDPGETRNLAADEPDLVARMTADVVAWHRSMPPDRGPALGSAPPRARSG